jgi:hypothetical protein
MGGGSSMSLSSDVKNDIKAAKKLWLPWWGVLSLMALSLPALWLFDHFGRLDMALPTLNCVLVLGLLVFLKWKLRRHAWFWIAMTIVAVLHLLLIWYVPWTTKWVPALAIAAIDSADFCIVLWILAVVGKLVERPKASEA